MGGFARVAVPMAAAAAFPYASAAMGAGASGLTTSAAMANVSPWAAIAKAGMSGLGQINTMRQERAQKQTAQARSEAEAARLKLQYDAKERKRRERLKATVAAQRARFGAAGVSSQGGSAGAVVSGLMERNARDEADAARDFTMRRSSLLEASRPARRDNFKLFQKTISPYVNLFD
jgi:hypothetical protein